ncbi:MAG: CCA tRNA nucleotidyltransferase [Thermomicrobiales bacterium]|nr:CCA tRNA nucleotidyltransferase [Thermomicrobiales bacterium]
MAHRFTTDGKLLLDQLNPDQKVLVDRLAEAFAAAGKDLYLVGGPVRDLLLGTTPADLDFTTNALPAETRVIGEAIPGTSIYDVGEQFGTIGIVLPSGDTAVPVEITTYRSEHYLPGDRHPEVQFGESIDIDLSRRDVTVNAIAINVATGEIVDPFYGRADIEIATLRAVGDADDRFMEDPLRLLRVARFVSQLGFTIDPATFNAMIRQAPHLEHISKERIYGELTRLLVGRYPDEGLQVLIDTGLLTEAMPELKPLAAEAMSTPGVHREKDLWEHTKRVVAQSVPRNTVRWAALLHDAAKPMTRSVDERGEVHFFGHELAGSRLAGRLLRNLKADKRTEKHVSLMVELHQRPSVYDAETWTDSAVRRLALEAGDTLHDLIDLAAADVTSGKAHKQRMARQRVEQLRAHITRLEEQQALSEFQSPIDGNELMTMFDRPPGRWIATIKDHLRELVIDGELAPDDVDRAREIAREMMDTL